MILGLDISTKCTGYCILKNGKPYIVGSVSWKPKTSIGKKLSDLAKLLKIWKHYFPNMTIYVEDIFAGRNMKTYATLAKCQGVVQQVYWEHNQTEPTIVTVKTIRAKFKLNMVKKAWLKNKDFGSKSRNDTAFRNAQKTLVLDFINKRFGLGLTEKQDDRADAVLVALYGYKETQC